MGKNAERFAVASTLAGAVALAGGCGVVMLAPFPGASKVAEVLALVAALAVLVNLLSVRRLP